MKHHQMKRLLALCLAVLMLASASSFTAFADQSTRGTTVDVGALSAHPDYPQQDSEGLIWSCSLGTVSDTWTNYYAASDDCVKLLKSGAEEAVSIGQLTQYGTSDGILLNRGDNVFCIRNSQWNLNCAGHSDLSPLAEGDVLIVGGTFSSSNGTTINITTTYITKDSSGNLTFSNAMPTSLIEAGEMQLDEAHPSLVNGNFYFKMDTNDIPYTEGGWDSFYATSADCIKLVRDGAEAVSVAIPTAGRGVFVKTSANGYYFNSGRAFYIGDNAPLKAGDKLIVEGNFTNDSVTFHVSKSVITVQEDDSLVFGEQEEDNPDGVIEAGTMKPSEKGKVSSGIYFEMDTNDVPADSTWSKRYKPVSADVIQRTTGDTTTDVGNVEAETVLKYSDTGWFIENWTIGGALQAGEILKVEGNFTDGTLTFHISESYIICNEDGSITITDSLPTPMTVVEAGTLKEDERGRTENGIYFDLDANEAPFNSDWSVLYKPETADCIKLVRGEETTSIARPVAETLIKFSETEYYLKTEAYTIDSAYPLQEGDILILEGNFINETNNTALHFAVSYIQIKDGKAVFSTEYPTEEEEPSGVIEAGIMKQSSLAKRSSGFYFEMTANDVPVDATWTTRYMPVSADVIKLTRDGETTDVGNTAAGTILKYSETNWWMEFWAIGGSLLPGDILTVEGNFTGQNGVTFHISKSYVVCNEDSSITITDTVTFPMTIVEAGALKDDERGKIDTGVYFDLDANKAPYNSDWSVSYKPETADCIKLVRGEETTSVAKPVAETIVKFSETEYFLKVEAWTAGDAYPLQEGDILILEGNFINEEANLAIHFDTAYIQIKNGKAVFSTEYPEEEVIIEAGSLHRSDKAPTDSGLYFCMDENEVPADATWSTRYIPVSADVIKLTRNGVTTNVGNTAGETILKLDDTLWYMEYWAIGGALQSGDVLTVSGNFTNGSLTFHITESTITMNEDGTLTVNGETPPEPVEVIEAGIMHRSEKAPTASGFYFDMDENEVPADDTWSTRYLPVSADVIKLTRNGVTTDVGNIAAETVLKVSDTGWYMEYWAIGGALQSGDVLTVEGNFTDGKGYFFHITESTVTMNEDGTLTVNGEAPAAINRVDAGYLQGNDAGRTENGIYCTMDANEAPFDTGWTVLYTPASADCIKLTRNGETTSIANPTAETLIKYSETDYYLKTEQWMMPGVWPLQEGDILTVEGDFSNSTLNTVIHISTSYIKIKYGQAVFSTEYPTDDEPAEVIQAGYLKQDAKPRTDTGIYCAMDANEAPFATDWSLEYTPVTASCVKLIRDGETTDVAIPGRPTLIKYGETGYYLKTEVYTMGDLMPLQIGDILVVEGQFVNGETVMEISKSYIAIRTGKTVISTEYPTDEEDEIIEAGVMTASASNPGLNVDKANGTCGLYFTMKSNAVPTNASDPWSNRFYPVDSTCIKLIRDGKTIDISNTEAGEIVKYSDTGYYLSLDKWAHKDVFPITESDILLVEGNFTDGNTVFHISQSYISFKYGTAVFTTEYPDGSESDFQVVRLRNVTSDSRGKTENGVYFDAAANAAPYSSSWSLEYCPVDETSVQLIRGGKAYAIGIPGRETIVKFSATEYYLKAEQWTIGGYAPLREGDVVVLSGEFVNAANNVVISIPTTYIGIWYGKGFVSSTYQSSAPVSTVQATDLLADERELQPAGAYFDMAENAAPSNSNWSLEYSPTSASCLQLIRDGETYNVAIESHGSIVKFSDTEYYLKLDNWSIGSYAPYQDGDIFVLSGSYICLDDASGTIINFPETYFFIQNGTVTVAKSMGETELKMDESTKLSTDEFPEGETVTWRSANEKRLEVDENGNVTALTNRGSIRVFATAGNQTWFWTVKMYEETEFGNVFFSSSEDDLPIAMWCGSYHSFTTKNLEELAEAGVTTLVGVREDQIGDGGMWALLNRARECGITVIADICGWDGTTEFSYAKHPALKGFLVWDGPAAADFEAIKALKDSFDEKMPDGLEFYVSLNSQLCTYEALFGDKEDADYAKDYVDAYIETVEPADLMLNVPSLRTADETDETAPLLAENQYFSCFDILAQAAMKNDLSLTYNMNCLGGKGENGTYAEPTEELLRWQFALGLTFGAEAVNQSAFASEDGTDAMFDTESGKTTDLFDTLSDINLEYASWGDIFLSYDWMGISKLDIGEESPLLAAIENDVPVGNIGCLDTAEAEQDLLLGCFKNKDGGFAYMITNVADAKAVENDETDAEFTPAATSVTLTFAEGEYQCVALICKGEITYVAVGTDNTVTFDLDANEGIFVIPFMK